MFVDEPYFMTNEEWFYFDIKKLKYLLTDKAPPKAVESYKEFYNAIEH